MIWDRLMSWVYIGNRREDVAQALCERRDRLEEQSRMNASQVEDLERQVRFWRWAAYEMAELARIAVAKYGNAKSPPASPLLATGLIMKMYERAAPPLLPQRLPGESMNAYQDRLLAVISPAAQMEALQLATGRTNLTAAIACLPYTTAEMFPKDE